MMDPADLQACREAIRTGSLSFHAASRLLPAEVRNPALALYAFCRLADDAVDESAEKAPAVLGLRDRLDLIYAGTPRPTPADRAFAAVVEAFDMPRALPDALLEGLAWDAMGRRYQTFSDLLSYAARVAAAVGAMMCVLMRVRSADALARACDLGLAMQLTNIARDVGEDARAGRLYLPLDWLAEAGIAPDAFLRDPAPDPRILALTRRLLEAADRFYARARAGVPALPLACRPGIYAAGHVYAGIGAAVARAGYDSISTRAHTSGRQKLGWLARAVAESGLSLVAPRAATLHAAPAEEVAFLVQAAARQTSRASRSEALLSVFAQLEAKDRAARRPERAQA